jgi:hypothetical protein
LSIGVTITLYLFLLQCYNNCNSIIFDSEHLKGYTVKSELPKYQSTCPTSRYLWPAQQNLVACIHSCMYPRPPFRYGIKLTFPVKCHMSFILMSADIHWMPSIASRTPKCQITWLLTTEMSTRHFNDMLLVSQVDILLWQEWDHLMNYIYIFFIFLYTGCWMD